MNKSNEIVALSVFLFLLFSIPIQAKTTDNGNESKTGVFSITEKKTVEKEKKGSSGSATTNPVKKPVKNDGSGEVVKETLKPRKNIGTLKYPYYIAVHTPVGNGGTLDNALKNAAGAVTNGTKYINYKIPAVKVSETTTLTYIPDYIIDASTPFHVRYVYSSIVITAKNTTYEKTTAKDKYYRWELSGPESWVKEVSTNKLTLTFNQPGTYRLSVSPFEERTITKSSTSSAVAYHVWPDIANKKSGKIKGYNTSVPETTEIVVAENKARRKEWIVEITAADVGIPFPIKPPVDGGNDVIIDPSLDITIVE